MAKLCKRLKAIREKIDSDKQYPIEEALKLVKDLSTVKFTESVDIAVNLGIDPKKSDQCCQMAQVRKSV
jgi:large subunit ribosomal protein L1